VLPFYKKSEADRDYTGDLHGVDGPMPVRRPHADELRPVSSAFIQACLNAGFSEDPDKNAPVTDGVGPIPRNVSNGMRMNTAVTYLVPARQRANLTVMGRTYVRRVRFEGTRAVGVEAERDGQPVRFDGREIILSAGGIKSPHLLMLSGIGPAASLQAHRIDVVHDSPGVGQNIKDHPSAHVNFLIRNDDTPLPENFMVFQTCLNHTAPGSRERSDIQISCGAASYRQMLRAVPNPGKVRGNVPSYLRRPVATVNALRRLPTKLVIDQARMQDSLVLLASLDAESSTGSLTLDSPDPRQAPGIKLNYLSDPADLPRLAANVRVAVDLLRDGAFKQLDVERISPSDKDLASDATLEVWIREHLGTAYHTMNTASMGPASDTAAVIDERCRVRGVEGLRVADLSIVPRIRRGPAATAVMIGERVATLIDEDG
jgi:choline dehydrogenase